MSAKTIIKKTAKPGRPELKEKDKPITITVRYHPSYKSKFSKAVSEFGSQRKALQGLLDAKYSN